MNFSDSLSSRNSLDTTPLLSKQPHTGVIPKLPKFKNLKRMSDIHEKSPSKSDQTIKVPTHVTFDFDKTITPNRETYDFIHTPDKTLTPTQYSRTHDISPNLSTPCVHDPYLGTPTQMQLPQPPPYAEYFCEYPHLAIDEHGQWININQPWQLPNVVLDDCELHSSHSTPNTPQPRVLTPREQTPNTRTSERIRQKETKNACQKKK
jgi:hypothetical protein